METKDHNDFIENEKGYRILENVDLFVNVEDNYDYIYSDYKVMLDPENKVIRIFDQKLKEVFNLEVLKIKVKTSTIIKYFNYL
jgi:hypothetical protein